MKPTDINISLSCLTKNTLKEIDSIKRMIQVSQCVFVVWSILHDENEIDQNANAMKWPEREKRCRKNTKVSNVSKVRNKREIKDSATKDDDCCNELQSHFI